MKRWIHTAEQTKWYYEYKGAPGFANKATQWMILQTAAYSDEEAERNIKIQILDQLGKPKSAVNKVDLNGYEVVRTNPVSEYNLLREAAQLKKDSEVNLESNPETAWGEVE